MQIAVFKPTIKRRDMDAVLSCLVGERIGPGAQGKALVQETGGYLGIAGGFALREYSRAIDLSLDAAGLGRGDAVVLSPLSPALYLDVMERRGISPLYADVDPSSGCVRPDEVARLLEKKAAAVIVHEPLGYMPEMPLIEQLGVPIIEDISMSIGAYLDERKSGDFGKLVIVGLEEEDIITAGGGALLLCRNNHELGLLRKSIGEVPEESLLSDMNATLALTQLRHIEEFLQRRKEIAHLFYQALLKTRHKTLMQAGEGENVFYSFPVVIDGSVKEVVKYARSRNVITKPAFEATILARHGLDSQELPEARKLLMRCLLFPLYPMLGKENVERIARVLSTLP